MTRAAMAVLLALAFLFGFLTWVSRVVWQSWARTGACAVVAIASTVALAALAWTVLP
ncbi:MAG: hypothetical protein ACUVV6_06960 [Thermoplasmatota archaeon]